MEKKFNAVVSDLAPKTSGIREKDNFESFVLSKRAFEIAKESLLEKGSFICKIFESPEVNNFLKEIKPFFKQVHLYKTKATPKGSREAFIVCLNFVG
ncbi:SAM-dependent methyltransferase [Candidatus Gribaldobacteria bacterium]|nr:SAM-dependent methyltransferase [Candidatus Gribaldobacteria bacterium]